MKGNPFVVISALVTFQYALVSFGQAQPPSGSSDRSSNGVIEIIAAPTLGPQPLRRSSAPPVEPKWEGLIKVKIKNVSRATIHLESTSLDYELTVLDSSGKEVPMTQYGKDVLAAQHRGPVQIGHVSTFDLDPGGEHGVIVDLASRFQIQLGTAYTVKIQRARGLPMRDASGWPLGYLRQVTTTLSIPEHWTPAAFDQ